MQLTQHPLSSVTLNNHPLIHEMAFKQFKRETVAFLDKVL